MDSKKIQQKIEAIAVQRKYWRELGNALGAEGGSVIVKGLRSRIEGHASGLLDELKIADPADQIKVAKSQASYKTCQDILLDFDLDTCNKKITAFDEQIAELNTELKRAQEEKKQVSEGGFSHLNQR